MSYIFGKLWHSAIIWPIRKSFQCILQGVRFLLASQTLLSGTSENESYQQKLQVATSNVIFQKRQNRFSTIPPWVSHVSVKNPIKTVAIKKTKLSESWECLYYKFVAFSKCVQICPLRGQCSWQPPDWKRRSFNHSLTKKTVSHWTPIHRIAHTHVAIQSIPFLCFLFLVQFFSSSKQIVGK